jgi:hypothetical protein
MSPAKRVFWAALAAYIVIHALYLLSGFNPIRDLQHLAGWVVDLSVWMAVYLSMYWLLGKQPKKPRDDDSIH